MSEKGAPRGFAVLLQEFQQGELHGQLTVDFHKIVSETQDFVSVTNNKGKAKLVLTIDLEMHPNGVTNITTDIKTKAPRVKLPPSPMWVDKNGTLQAQDPRQANLFPRDVSAPRKEAVDVQPQRKEAKDVS